MLRILTVCALIAAAAAAGSSPRITPLGIVEGIRDCGSPGRLGTVDVQDCTVVPCHFVPNNMYDVALRFVASVTSQNLSFELYKVQGGDVLWVVPIDGEIQAGIEYELKFKLPISQELAGQAFDIRFYILDTVTHLNEICAQAAAIISS